jgi:predicted nucleic acid-binding protein
MLKVIFDTNIYGLLLKEKDAGKIERKIVEDKEFLVYGYQPIRKEIRDIPKTTKLSKKTRFFY